MHEEIRHPCVQHKLALMRDKDTGHKKFRELATEITMFVCYEALKNISVKEVEVETPLKTATCHKIAEDLVVVPILRAGVGMLDGILSLVPSARVGFVGLYRDEVTKEPVTYYQRLPPQTKGGLCIRRFMQRASMTGSTRGSTSSRVSATPATVCMAPAENRIPGRQ
jgi:uracil phosphoribosyltransferase